MKNPIIKYLMIFFDFASFVLGFFISYKIANSLSMLVHNNPDIAITSHIIDQRIIIYLIGALVAMFAMYNRGHYTRIVPWWSSIKYISSILIFLTLIDGFYYFTIKQDFSRLWVASSWITVFPLIIVGRLISKFLSFDKWYINTILIGDCKNITETLYAIKNDFYAGYKLTKIIIPNDSSRLDKSIIPAKYQNVEIIYGIENAKLDNLLKEDNNFYILAFDAESQENSKNEITQKITDNSASYAIVPPIGGVNLYGSQPQYYFGSDLMFIIPRNNINKPFSLFVKRLLDLFVSIIILIFGFPVLLAIFFAIKLDGGSALYSQTRIGRHGKEFKFWKFRSMKVNAEEELKILLSQNPEMQKLWDVNRKLKNDPRVTKIGKFLRKSSLDEIPQLFNVIIGNMSLIGPRPILPDEKHFFSDSQYKVYCSAKPGISGLWQVSGRSDTSFAHRVKMDWWYVKNWSFWSDIVILIKTFFTLIKRDGAY